MSEGALWDTVRTALLPWGALKRIENSVDLGTPDVLYCLRRPRSVPRVHVTGWVELKHLPAWPVRPDTPVVIDHLTREQVLFLEDWPGAAYLLLQVEKDYLLTGPWTARGIFNRQLNRRDLWEQALIAETPFPLIKILTALTS